MPATSQRRHGSRRPAPAVGRARHGARRAAVLLLACALALGAGSGALAAPGPSRQTSSAVQERASLLGAFLERMRADDLTAAAAAARRYLEIFPDDGAMSYNLACVEARRGALELAWPALERALAGPLADPRLAASDPDLAPLRSDPRFERLLAACRTRLVRETEGRAIRLRDGHESEERLLRPNGGGALEAGWPEVAVRLTAGDGALLIKARVRAERFLARPQPWRNGDGFRVTIVAPPPTEASGFDGDRWHGLGFGVEDDEPVGAVIEQDGHPREITVLDLAPKVRLQPADQTATYTIRIPWDAVAPYAPPLDTLLGLNVSYLHVGQDRVRRVVSLAPDPALAGPEGPWRRYVPVHFARSELSLPILRGAVSNTLVENGNLGVQLLAWLPLPTAATLAVDILDAAGRSVVEAGGETQLLAAEAGLNRWQRGADLAALPTGPFRVRALLAPAGSDTLRWQTDVLRLEPRWLAEAQRMARDLAAGDQPSLELRLDVIADELARHHARAPVTALASTIVETGRLLQRGRLGKSVLPDSGGFLAGYRDAAGKARPCFVRLPGGHPAPTPHRLLMVIGGAGPGARRFGASIADLMPAPADLVIVAPELPPADPAAASRAGSAPGESASAAAAALAWARQRFGAREVLLAGVDEGVDVALALAGGRAAHLSRVLLVAGTEEAAKVDLDAGRLPADRRARTAAPPCRVVAAGSLNARDVARLLAEWAAEDAAVE